MDTLKDYIRFRLEASLKKQKAQMSSRNFDDLSDTYLLTYNYL